MTTSPCPFCGTSNAAPNQVSDKLWWVSCSKCGAIGPAAKDKLGAQDAWDKGAARFLKTERKSGPVLRPT